MSPDRSPSPLGSGCASGLRHAVGAGVRGRGLTTLASFGTGTSAHSGVTFDTQGNLYGTTDTGGSNGVGTVYEIAKGSNTITTLASFDGTNGTNPYAGVTIDANGNLYGTTEGGGLHYAGTVWEIAKGSNTISTLAAFDGTNGLYQESGVTLDAQGTLYGTSNLGVLVQGVKARYGRSPRGVARSPPSPTSVERTGLTPLEA